MAFIGKDPIRSTIVINDQILEQVNSFKYLGSDVLYLGKVINHCLNEFHE